LLVSVAGWHVAIAGAENPGRESRLLIAAEPPSASLDGPSPAITRILAENRKGAGDPLAAGFARGEPHTLRVELTKDRSQIQVVLDGKAVGPKTGPRPPADARAIVVRSVERVLLRRVTLTAGIAQ
jgi:hypothetical protein